MRISLTTTKKSLVKYGGKTVAVGILLFSALFAVITAWKYGIFGYNAIDLAYFNQVFWNTLHGHFFQQTIHPHLSLGDHAGLAIPLLLPFYALKADPRTLLALQALALALPAWPLYKITKLRVGNFHSSFLRAVLPVGVASAWLMSPIVQNIAMFEFHILPFALLPLFFALLAYERQKKLPFLIFSLLALLVREDVSFVIVAIGILAWLEKRSMWWRIVPTLIGSAWFFIALRIITFFNPDGGYKFLVYYAWLGNSFSEIALNALLHPLKVLQHMLTIPNIEMVIGFGMPLFFLPFVRPKRLILALGVFLQIVLAAPGGGELTLQTHYSTLFLPAIFLAGIEGIRVLPSMMKKIKKDRATQNVRFSLVLLAVAVIYSMLVIGPLPSVLQRLGSEEDMERKRVLTDVLHQIPSNAAVAAGYTLLPHLSSRESLYSLHYHFLGVTQFATEPYALPAETDLIAFDTYDVRKYQTQFPITRWTVDRYEDGYARLRSVLGAQLFSRGTGRLYEYVSMEQIGKETMAGQVAEGTGILATEKSLHVDTSGESPVLDVALTWSTHEKLANDLMVRLDISDGGKIARTRIFPFAGGLMSAKELGGHAVRESLHIPLDGLAPGEYGIRLSLEIQDTYLAINGIRATEIFIKEKKTVATVPFDAIVIE